MQGSEARLRAIAVPRDVKFERVAFRRSLQIKSALLSGDAQAFKAQTVGDYRHDAPTFARQISDTSVRNDRSRLGKPAPFDPGGPDQTGICRNC